MIKIRDLFRPKLKIEMTDPDPMLRPSKTNDTDACFDIKANVEAPDVEIIFSPGQHFLRLPFKAEVPIWFFRKYCLDIRPKSGLALEYGFTIVNSPGTVDYGYKDNVCICFTVTKPLTVRKGMKIAQMKLTKLENEWLEFVDSISEKDDRGGGHGSTGKF